MTKVILIVDDDPISLKLAGDMLRANGYPTIEATNGKQALKLAEANQPALILMDIRMPVMDGLEATRRLKKNATTKDIPIIALTALAMKDEEEKIRQAGCDGYLTKPLDIQQLLKEVAKYLPGGKKHD